MKVGDLVQPNDRMRFYGCNGPAIVIGTYGEKYVLVFPDGSRRDFYPSDLKPDKN